MKQKGISFVTVISLVYGQKYNYTFNELKFLHTMGAWGQLYRCGGVMHLDRYSSEKRSHNKEGELF